jgi:hypothetical protein
MHPLRPKEGYILVCEGNDDAVFLNGILSKPEYSNNTNLSIFNAGGSQNVPLLASILSPSVYIRDRDFDTDFAQAKDSLVSTDRFTVWKRHDMESYLIYPDWLFQVVIDAQSSPKLSIRNAPENEDDVYQQIQHMANQLVFDHAGHKTLALMTKRLGTVHLQYKLNRQIVSGGAVASEQDDWERLFEVEYKRVQDILTKASTITLQDVMDEFHMQIEFYDSAKDNFELLQQEFSGKRIIQMLEQKWNLTGGKGKPWKVIQRGLLNYVRSYVNSRQGLLSDDVRLGDVGLLASKVFSTKI